MKNCENKRHPPKCLNCERHHGEQDNALHSAMDAVKCPILRRKIEDKIAYIKYD